MNYPKARAIRNFFRPLSAEAYNSNPCSLPIRAETGKALSETATIELTDAELRAATGGQGGPTVTVLPWVFPSAGFTSVSLICTGDCPTEYVPPPTCDVACSGFGAIFRPLTQDATFQKAIAVLSIVTGGGVSFILHFVSGQLTAANAAKTKLAQDAFKRMQEGRPQLQQDVVNEAQDEFGSADGEIAFETAETTLEATQTAEEVIQGIQEGLEVASALFDL